MDKKKRCPNGTRKNKQGECVSKNSTKPLVKTEPTKNRKDVRREVEKINKATVFVKRQPQRKKKK